MRSLKKTIAIMAALGFLGAGTLSPPAQGPLGNPGTSLPPRRVPFQHRAPDEVILAKLWWDIGHFSPFTGSISRDAWEKGFFKILNEHVEGRIDLAQATAETVALLNDPHQLVLAPGEGHGQHFLPVIFEVRGGNAWIIGGDKTQVPAAFGPITSVDGAPIEAFLSKRLGSNQSPERIFAAFTMAAIQTAPFNSAFGSPRGTLTLSSIDALKKVKEPWIEGGWKGIRLSEIQGMPRNGLVGLNEKIPSLDLRDAHWQMGLVPDPLQTTLILRGASAPDDPVVRIVREHRGVYEADWDRYAHDSYSFNRIGAHPAPSRIAWVQKTAPCPVELPPVLLHEYLAEILAGWALPAHRDTAAATTLLELTPQLTVRLRTQSWTPGLSAAKHVATYRNGALLNMGAAKALATATILNFDHYYGFTPEDRQARLFSRMMTIHAETQTAAQVVARSGWATGDLHGTTGLYLSGELPDPLWETMLSVGVNQTWPNSTLLMANPYLFKDGKLRFLSSSEGIRSGQILHSINGIQIDDILHNGMRSIPHREDIKDPFLPFLMLSHPAFGIGQHFAKYTPKRITLEVSTKGDTAKTQIRVDAGRPLQNDPAPKPPAGWKHYSYSETPPTLSEIIESMESGKKVILDARIPGFVDYPWYSGPRELPSPYSSPIITQIRRTPTGPSAWGARLAVESGDFGNANPVFSATGVIAQNLPKNPKLKGKVVVVVDGTVASLNEAITLFLKEAFPENVAIVGLPSGGCMGVMSYVYIYAGNNSTNIIPYSPTASSFLYNDKSTHLKGLQLDYQITDALLLKSIDSGTTDALLSSAYWVVSSFINTK